MLIFPATSLLGQAFADILNGLCAMLGHYATQLRDRSVLLSLIHWRVSRMIRRLDHLALRWQANTLPKPKSHPKSPRPNRPGQPPRLPAGKFWLIRALQPSAQFSLQFENFLARPDTRALVEAAPQAGRILRPLCRGYGLTLPPWLRLPARAVAPRPPRARAKPRSPALGAPIAATTIPPTPDRPIPRYILAAARAWRKYDR